MKVDQTKVLCTRKLLKTSLPPNSDVYHLHDECKGCVRAKGVAVRDGQAWMMPPAFTKENTCPKKLSPPPKEASLYEH
jgi:hypothetical protein